MVGLLTVQVRVTLVTFPRDGSTLILPVVAVLADSEASISGRGTVSISNEIFNLVNSIVGASALSLPMDEGGRMYGYISCKTQ